MVQFQIQPDSEVRIKQLFGPNAICDRISRQFSGKRLLSTELLAMQTASQHDQ